jgi:glycine betaine/proline transport system substrate-binding protein
MGWNAEGAEPYDSAKRWINENPDKVAEWLK